MADHATMTPDEITEEYSKDSPKLSATNFQDETAKVPLLISKYRRLHSVHHVEFLKLNRKLAKLYKDKYVHYTQGASKETRDLGWEVPTIKIMKADVPMYLNADKEYAELQEQVELARHCVNILEDCCKELQYRSKNIETFFGQIKWFGGG